MWKCPVVISRLVREGELKRVEKNKRLDSESREKLIALMEGKVLVNKDMKYWIDGDKLMYSFKGRSPNVNYDLSKFTVEEIQ